MKNELDVKQGLTVFNQVLSKGELQEGKYQWQGLTAWHDIDGYTCYLQYNQVLVTLMFHGKYATDYPNDDAWHQFMKKIKLVAQETSV
ncbi:MAG: DUF3081 domain-containing protein [Thalassotalea sp.]|nr:DUF3081 domain-containing protein [Thalassotalea sp.]